MSKVNDLSLEFDEEACVRDLIQCLVDAVQQCFNQLRDDMKARSGSGRTSKRASDISWEFIARVTYNSVENKIEGIVGNTNWKALIDNYGSGSRMERDFSKNPWLSYYLNSQYFNKARKRYSDLRVVARPAEPYPSPDWEGGDGYLPNRAYNRPRKVGSGMTDENGDLLDLENNHPKGTGMPFYTPIKGKHWFENVWAQAETKLDDYLQMALDQFDFSAYLKGGVE